jgi:EAL domain-containing protein (putative c-di-GMP-specific phosphodiesterase class I)
MAKAEKQEVVAKYVGDKKVMQALTKLGVDYGQGYYFSKAEELL